MTQTWEYTLTGFIDFYERRRFAFLERLPDSRVCSVCGLVPSHAWQLPCSHVVCHFCQQKIEKESTCPVDNEKYDIEKVKETQFPVDDLQKLRARCGVAGADCDFVGTLLDMKQHMAKCVADKEKCARCDGMVVRREAVDHCRQCASGSTSPEEAPATGVVPPAVLDTVRVIKEKVEALQQEPPSEDSKQEGAEDPVTSLMEQVVVLQRQLEEMKEVARVLDQKTPTEDSGEVPQMRGPYRAASKPGVSLAMCIFEGTCAKAGLAATERGDITITSSQMTLAGYTFRLKCRFLGADRPKVGVRLFFSLEMGEWDDHIAWPFTRKVTLVLSHPVDADKDIRLPLDVTGLEDAAAKPVPNACSEDYMTEAVDWDRLLRNGLVAKEKLYVNVEIE